MTAATVTAGKDSWVGQARPKATHFRAARLHTNGTSAYAFVHLKTPVPPGETVASGVLQIKVVGDHTGTFTFTARRVASRVDWSDLCYDAMPGVTGSWKPTVTVTDPKDGDLLEFDVATHLQTVANGGKHYGWRIEVDAATTVRLYGFDSVHPPKLVVGYSGPPSQPTDISPAGIVSVAKPTLTFTAPDLTGDDDMVQGRWQIDPARNETTPAFDSGVVDTLEPELDLTTTTYPGLADAASTYQRVQWKNSTGVWSPWSDWVPFSRVAKAPLTVDNPPASGLVTDVTPPLIATLDAAATLTAYKILIVDPTDPSEILATSRKRKATSNTMSWTPPEGVLDDDGSYRAIFYAWDDVDRVLTPGDPRRIKATRDFTVTEVATVAAPTGLTATQPDPSPRVVLSWSIATAPDSFTILDNGKPIAANIDPADVVVSGTSYQWTDTYASPSRSHTYRVRAVVNGEQSPKSGAASITPEVDGIWIIDPDYDQAFVLGGEDAKRSVAGWRMRDDVGTYQVFGSSTEIDVFAGSHGLAGTLTGDLYDRPRMGLTLDGMEADLWAIKGRRGRKVRLVLGDMSIPVRLRHLSCGPHPDHNRSAPRRLVSLEFTQAGGLPFKVGP